MQGSNGVSELDLCPPIRPSDETLVPTAPFNDSWGLSPATGAVLRFASEGVEGWERPIGAHPGAGEDTAKRSLAKRSLRRYTMLLRDADADLSEMAAALHQSKRLGHSRKWKNVFDDRFKLVLSDSAVHGLYGRFGRRRWRDL